MACLTNYLKMNTLKKTNEQKCGVIQRFVSRIQSPGKWRLVPLFIIKSEIIYFEL